MKRLGPIVYFLFKNGSQRFKFVGPDRVLNYRVTLCAVPRLLPLLRNRPWSRERGIESLMLMVFIVVVVVAGPVIVVNPVSMHLLV